MIHTDNPVLDAEDYYCSLYRPDREGTVTMTLVVTVPATGRDEDELRENGFQKLSNAMPTFVDWDWSNCKAEFDEE